MKRKIITAALFSSFVMTVYGANWALATFGIVQLPFGFMGPAGVYFAGLAFGLRDALHEIGGVKIVLLAILTGTIFSYVVEDGVVVPGGLVAIAVASAAAFFLAEMADLFVYNPLREKNWGTAVVLSNVVGSVTDSAVFLFLAFGSIDFIVGQTVGKMTMIALALPLVFVIRKASRAVSRNVLC